MLPWVATAAAQRQALDMGDEIMRRAAGEARAPKAPPQWTTPNRLVLDLPTMRLREFSESRQSWRADADRCSLCLARCRRGRHRRRAQPGRDLAQLMFGSSRPDRLEIRGHRHAAFFDRHLVRRTECRHRRIRRTLQFDRPLPRRLAVLRFRRAVSRQGPAPRPCRRADRHRRRTLDGFARRQNAFAGTGRRGDSRRWRPGRGRPPAPGLGIRPRRHRRRRSGAADRPAAGRKLRCRPHC